MNVAKPFLKWAGGKGQLIKQIEENLPSNSFGNKITKYAEPFIGGGALFFHLVQKYDFETTFISDINKELILGYAVVKKEVESLIKLLNQYQTEFRSFENIEDNEVYYFSKRTYYRETLDDFDFSQYNSDWIERAAHLIFLNKTCFNGLFRVNKKGYFNVPFSKVSNQTICDEKNLMNVSKILQKTRILRGDFTESNDFIDENTFVYFDPPYRPINATSHFTDYSKFTFNDEQQKRLAMYFSDLNKKNAKLMLSNSDPKNHDQEDNFFDELYSNFNIKRVDAKRSINSKGQSRGKIKEILVRNYE